MATKPQLILVGGGGHCKSCIDVIESSGQYDIHGILDRADLVGTKVSGYEIIGTDDDIAGYCQQGFHFLVTIGQIKNAAARIRVFTAITNHNGMLPVIISSRAHVSATAQIGAGTIIMHFACVNAAAVIGMGCIVNTKSLVEHEAVIGNFTHISTGAIVNGNCSLGNEVFLGSNAVVKNDTRIGNNCVIGIGAAVINDIDSNSTVAGVPAKNIYA